MGKFKTGTCAWPTSVEERISVKKTKKHFKWLDDERLTALEINAIKYINGKFRREDGHLDKPYTVH